MASRKRLFFAGGSGLLALNWALMLHEKWDVFLGLHNRKISPSFASTVHLLSQPTTQDWITTLSEISPDVVVNAAAVTSIEYCEQNPEIAFAVNVLFAEELALACNLLKIPLVHISTDHLYSGLASFATEQTRPDPMNVYGKTKAEAESRVLHACSNALVIRTNFYGWGTSYRHSITDKVIHELQAGNVYTAFDDVYFTPILIADLVSAIHQLLELGANGIINLVGDERVSKYDFCRLLVNTFRFQSSLLQPISIDEVPALVQRPKDMSLSNLKATKWLNRGFKSVGEGLICLRDQLNQGYSKELQQL
jgi:dTDP-4-dehydrorhamnose reductase